jgi:hypothetical protein
VNDYIWKALRKDEAKGLIWTSADRWDRNEWMVVSFWMIPATLSVRSGITIVGTSRSLTLWCQWHDDVTGVKVARVWVAMWLPLMEGGSTVEHGFAHSRAHQTPKWIKIRYWVWFPVWAPCTRPEWTRSLWQVGTSHIVGVPWECSGKGQIILGKYKILEYEVFYWSFLSFTRYGMIIRALDAVELVPRSVSRCQSPSNWLPSRSLPSSPTWSSPPFESYSPNPTISSS